MLSDAAISSLHRPDFLSPAWASGSDEALKAQVGGAVSWGAVFAGASAAASMSLILLVLGAGLGLAAVSPWSEGGLSASAFGVSAIAWTTSSQVMAAGLGGYLSGRLRSRWVSVAADEVYFRDTAHGFLAWAIATLVTAALLGAAASGLVGSATRLGASMAGDALDMAAAGPAASTAGMALAAAKTVSGANGAKGVAGVGARTAAAAPVSLDYAVDALFRPVAAGLAPPAGAPGEEAGAVARILAHALLTGGLSDDDAGRAAEWVSQRTGLGAADAQERVRDIHSLLSESHQAAQARAKEVADHARKVSSYAALWLFISLLIGAFVASVAAIWGGRRRDV